MGVIKHVASASELAVDSGHILDRGRVIVNGSSADVLEQLIRCVGALQIVIQVQMSSRGVALESLATADSDDWRNVAFRLDLHLRHHCREAAAIVCRCKPGADHEGDGAAQQATGLYGLGQAGDPLRGPP